MPPSPILAVTAYGPRVVPGSSGIWWRRVAAYDVSELAAAGAVPWLRDERMGQPKSGHAPQPAQRPDSTRGRTKWGLNWWRPAPTEADSGR